MATLAKGKLTLQVQKGEDKDGTPKMETFKASGQFGSFWFEDGVCDLSKVNADLKAQRAREIDTVMAQAWCDGIGRSWQASYDGK